MAQLLFSSVNDAKFSRIKHILLRCKCVDIFAPGHLITAAWIGSRSSLRTISGTSMASPHVCGVLALLAAEGDYTPEELKKKLLSIATLDRVENPGFKSPNKLLFSGVSESIPMSSVVESLQFRF